MSPEITSLLIFLGIGLLAGWIASLILGGGGLLRNLIVGVIGSVVGRYVLTLAKVELPIEYAPVRQVVTATVGAVGVGHVARVSVK